MQKRAGLLLALVLALATASVVSAGKAYAHPPYIPDYLRDGDDKDCAPVNIPNVHKDGYTFAVTPDPTSGPIPPGTPVTATASILVHPEPALYQEVQIRFIWVNKDTNTELYMTVLPAPAQVISPDNIAYIPVSDTQTFNPPNPTEYEVTACFEARRADNPSQFETIAFATEELIFKSFFVLPESAVGAVALASAPIAALGFYLYRKNSL